MHNSYMQAVEDYEKETGTNYDDKAYPTPSSVPPNLLKIVAEMKVFGAAAMQLDIISEVRGFMGEGGIAHIPPEKEHLLKDMDEFKKIEKVWSEVLNT